MPWLGKGETNETSFGAGNIESKLPRPGGRKIKDAAELLAAGDDYFQWVEANPLKTTKKAVINGKLVAYEEEHNRPPTISGFCQHIGIVLSCFDWWRKHKDEEFREAAIAVREAILTRQIEGGMAGIYNPGLTARVAGLADRVQQQIAHTPPPPPVANRDVANLIHPDDPDPLGDDRPLYSQAQLEAGVPFTEPCK